MDTLPRVLDPASPAFAADPYPAYAIARESGPVFRQPDDHRYYLTRFADVHAAFRDRRLGSPDDLGAPPARMELETTLGELASSEEELVVLPGAARRPTFQFRGYERLEVALHAR